MLDGTTPAPPLSHLTGMRLEEFDTGSATFSMPLSGWLAGSDGTIPLGPLTLPADAAMACAIIADLPPGTGLTTSELSIRRVRPTRPGGTVLARARVIDPGPPVALAEVTLTDSEGGLIARAGSLCVTLPALSSSPAPESSPSDPAPVDRQHTPDPWERPVAPGPVAPLAQLVGLRQVSTGRGEAAVVLPATAWLCAPPPGRAQGGAVATLAEAALTAAIATAGPDASRFQPVELKLNYLRPLASDGREARARGYLIHFGRRIAVAGAEVTDADGRTIAVATGSAVAVRSG